MLCLIRLQLLFMIFYVFSNKFPMFCPLAVKFNIISTLFVYKFIISLCFTNNPVLLLLFNYKLSRLSTRLPFLVITSSCYVLILVKFSDISVLRSVLVVASQKFKASSYLVMISVVVPSPEVHSETSRHRCWSYIKLSVSVVDGDTYSYKPEQLFSLNTNMSFTNEQPSNRTSALLLLILVNLFKSPNYNDTR